jgi:hypothetical protein
MGTVFPQIPIAEIQKLAIDSCCIPPSEVPAEMLLAPRSEDGRSVTDHNEKAALLLDDFGKRMGVSSSPIMLYQLNQLVQARDNLDSLSRPFSTLDIDEVVKHMPALMALMVSS